MGDERKKSEELQFSVDEAQFCGDELNVRKSRFEKFNIYRLVPEDLDSFYEKNTP